MKKNPRKAGLLTQSEQGKSDSAGCAMCPSGASNFCICQVIFANIHSSNASSGYEVDKLLSIVESE